MMEKIETHLPVEYELCGPDMYQGSGTDQVGRSGEGRRFTCPCNLDLPTISILPGSNRYQVQYCKSNATEETMELVF